MTTLDLVQHLLVHIILRPLKVGFINSESASDFIPHLGKKTFREAIERKLWDYNLYRILLFHFCLPNKIRILMLDHQIVIGDHHGPPNNIVS